MTQLVTSLGEIGAVGGIVRPIVLALTRDGAVWDLTGYTAAEFRVWDTRTKTAVAVNGSAAITGVATGEVTYTPGASDPIAALSGQFEARVWVTPAAGDREPSDLYRFTIGAGPTAS